MKNILGLLALFATVAFGSVAVAETYVGVGVGTSVASLESFNLDDGNSIDVNVGTDVGPLRVEGDVARIDNTTNLFGVLDARVTATRYSAMAYYDLPLDTNVKPYVGAGVAYTDATASAFGSSIDATGWGWQAAAGARAHITDSVTADVGVRYNNSALEADYFGDVDTEDYQLRAGFTVAL